LVFSAGLGAGRAGPTEAAFVPELVQKTEDSNLYLRIVLTSLSEQIPVCIEAGI
jgi:hypothetical protein